MHASFTGFPEPKGRALLNVSSLNREDPLPRAAFSSKSSGTDGVGTATPWDSWAFCNS